MPLDGFVASITADMILNIGFNEHFNGAPPGLEILPGRFLLHILGGSFLLFLVTPGFSLGIEFGALRFGSVFRDR